jgi:hypothetical protein
VYCDPASVLSRIRLNTDYAEVCVKPEEPWLGRCWRDRRLVPRLNDQVICG